MSEGPWASSEGSWTWLIARCWWPSWIQRAPQLVQVAIGYRPKPMVTKADRHSGQRGMGDLSGRLLGCGRWGSRTSGGGGAGLLRPLWTQLGVVSSLLAAGMVARPGRTWMRLGVASSILGTTIWSTPLSNEASICSAWTWAGRVIDRRKAP